MSSTETAPDSLPQSPDPAERPGALPPASRATATGTWLTSNRSWRVLAWVAPVLCLAVNAYVLWDTRWPAFPFDEVNLLQISRMLGGEEISDVIRGAGYFPGWSVLTAPVWWFTSDPSVGYRATLWIGVAVSLLTIWPIAQVVRRFGVDLAPAVVIATFAVTLPARAVQADFSMSERLVTLLLMCAVLQAFRVAERPSVLRHLVFAATLGLLFFSHVRMSVVVAAAGVWLLIRLPRAFWPSLVGLGATGVAYYLADRAGRALNEAVMKRPFNQGDNLWDKVEESTPWLFARVAMGQSWGQSLASFGLVAIGLVVLVALVWRELRRWEFGGATFIVGATTAITLISLAQWASDFLLFFAPRIRLDAWVYGRYIDPVATIVTAIGLAVLLKGVSRATAWWGVGLNAAVAVAGLVVLSRQVPTWGFVTPAHIPGVLPWSPLLPDDRWAWPAGPWILPTPWGENGIWFIAPLCVLAVLVAALLLRRHAVVVAGVLLALAAVGTVISTGPSEDFHAREEGYFMPMRERIVGIADLSPDEPIGYARECGPRQGVGAVAQNYFGYLVAPSPMRQILEPEDIGDMPVVIGCERWEMGEELGARRVVGDSSYASHVWIMPGPLQDELAQENRLLPPFLPSDPPPDVGENPDPDPL